MDKAFEILGAAGYPTTLVGGVLFLFFYLRKAEAGMRTEINGSLARLQKDKTDLQAIIDGLEQEVATKEKEIDEARTKRREAEDREFKEKRRADDAEAKLRRHGLMD